MHDGARRAGERGVLPRSSAHRIINKQAVPRSLEQFKGFLRACDVPEASRAAWEQAWSRAWRLEKQDQELGGIDMYEPLLADSTITVSIPAGRQRRGRFNRIYLAERPRATRRTMDPGLLPQMSRCADDHDQPAG
ncbi:hypothetical protein ABZ438_10275 [Streptomyces sp. NPDC005786]|uniref:hypothetical protein n=1 Tax=Streptomyces sp. NPDC005786 TaxID=3154891 RepID=UPI0033D8042E